MRKEARHHHFLPKFYLRGFLPSNQKNSKITVLDLERRRYFPTNIRNIGGVRDFNRIKAKGILPDSLENSLSSFEGQAATALRELQKEQSLKNKNTYAIIMNLIALIAIRNPQMRRQWSDFQTKVTKQLMSITTATKERWESTLRKMREDGVEVDENVSYEQTKEFWERGEYKINVPTESHIDVEFQHIDIILPFLFNRGWKLAIASDGAGPFITCDRPVCLTWKYPEKLSPAMRHSPGFGMKDTEVVFPISKNMAIIGEFEIKNQIVTAQREMVSYINSRIIYFAISQVYVPDLSFGFIDGKDNIREGCEIFLI